jgi:hypothetical protein
VRNHLRAGNLKATKRPGKFGPEWHFKPAVLAAFAAERYGREVDFSQVAPQGQGGRPPQAAAGPESLPEDVRELYERLVTVTEEAARYRAIAEVSESTKAEAERQYQGMIAELQQERDAALAKAAETAADLERLRSRGFWSRLFGGAGTPPKG